MRDRPSVPAAPASGLGWHAAHASPAGSLERIALRVNAERVVLFGWSRAILLQMAHPLIAAGVHDHSGFRASPLAAIARLHHTVGAMRALTFGSADMRRRTLDAILAIHRRVNGHLAMAAGPFPAGTRYSAEDPDLVLWVHVTLLESVPLVYERVVAPLTPAERDAYCLDAADVALQLGARDAEVPRTWAEAERYRDRIYASGMLQVTSQGREIGRALLAPRWARAVYPAAWANRIVTLGLLPPAIRQQYGFAWGPGHDRALRAVLGSMRALRRITPSPLALWPDARRGPTPPA